MENTYTYEERRVIRNAKKAYRKLLRTSIIAIVVAIIGTAVITSNVCSRKTLVQVDTIEVKVEEYDSIWGLTHDYCPSNMDMRDFVTIVSKINNISDSTIYVGQYLEVPVFEEVMF